MGTMPFERIFLIVMDSVGIGEAPDAANFGDEGADTLGSISREMNGLYLPNLGKLGLSHIREIRGVKKNTNPEAYYGKMREASIGKDTMTGHWEIMGLRIDKPFQVFPEGFPPELIIELEKQTGRRVIGNKVASGTEIIKELAFEQEKTGALIVYTSADSVLQIAAHEEIVPLQELYEICRKARALTLHPPYMVGRVIARPFIGTAGIWERTPNRRDYALKPFGRTVMNELADQGFDSIALGKIFDIFDGEGITESIRTISNEDGMNKLLEVVKRPFKGLSFINLVDFDAKYGHRRDPIGYGKALEQFDEQLGPLMTELGEKDLLIITADHGNDPTFKGTDHTREYVPLLVYSKNKKEVKSLGVRETFSDIGAMIAENFALKKPAYGTSFLKEIQ